MNYCIIKFKKIKENLELSEYGSHNLRSRIHTKRKESIEDDRSHLNKVLINKIGAKGGDFGKKLNEYYQNKSVKIKKDSVLGIDLICTTSPEYWGDWKTDPALTGKLDAWVKVQTEFIEEKFGKDAILSAILHLDETTPHIHFFITPEHEKEVNFKNRYGTTTKKQRILDANRWPPAFWTSLVDEYAKKNEVFGLQRGEVGSKRVATPLKDYKKALEKEIKRTNKLGNSYAQALENDDAQKALIINLSKENKTLRSEVVKLNNELAKLRTLDNIKKGVSLSDDELERLGL